MDFYTTEKINERLTMGLRPLELSEDGVCGNII